MGKTGKVGVARVIDAFIYSIRGLSAAWKYEAAFRQEVTLALILIPLAVFLAQTPIELLLLISSIVWVLMAELANSAVEAVVDRIGSEYHELSGRAKDIGSALVFVALILMLLIWGIIGFHRFVEFCYR